MANQIENIIFDLGWVLIDWNPRHLYRKIWPDDAERMEYFLKHICTGDWNVRMDAGKTLQSSIDELLQEHDADWHTAINIWRDRWQEMLHGEISETANLLRALHAQNKYRLYALTNWSAETFPYALNRFDFLRDCFRNVVVSGELFMIKPDREIFEYTLNKHGLIADKTLFIDDSAANAAAARSLGMRAIRFESPSQLVNDLKNMGVEIPEVTNAY